MKRRADGRYQLSVMVGYGADGKPKRKLVYGKTQKEVKDKASDLRMQCNMGIELDNDITLGEWAEIWLRTYKSGVEYNTVRMYSYITDNYVKKTLGHVKLKDVKTAHLQKIINDNSQKSWVCKKFRLTATQMLEQAAINDLIVRNPARGIVLPAFTKQSQKRAFTDDEMERVKSLPLNDKDKCFIMVLLYTGMRKGEALALSMGDIDIAAGQITVDKTAIFKANQSYIKNNPKTKAGVRVIPLLKPLRDILEPYIESIDTDFIFPAVDGGTMSETAYRHMWRRFCAAMGTTEITAHFFRHNFATMLYNAGVDVKAAQSILGHSSIAVTMDIYTHLGAKNQDAAAGKLNDFLSSSSTNTD